MPSNDDVLRAHFKALRPPTQFRGDEIIVARNAESIADVFPDWVERCKLDEALYQPFDLNMPVRVPHRDNMTKAYQEDPPVSEVGRIMAQIFARELVTRNAVPKAIYSSPSLVCVQTAADIRSFIGSDCGKVHVEPALASGHSDVWISVNQLAQLKYHVDESYTPEKTENDKSFRARQDNMKKLLPKLAQSKGVVLIVTDALAVKILLDQNEVKGTEETSIEPSRLYLRPITVIGHCTRPEVEVSTDANAKP